MKFSFALALLGQTVPTLSKRNGPVIASDGGLGLNDAKLQKATSLQSRGGLRRFNRRLMRHQMARNLKNSPRSVLKAMTMVPCDPRSTDADVGILSCGPDHICEPSSTSSLGGICAPLEYQDFEHDSLLRWKGPLLNNYHQSLATTGNAMVQCDPTLLDVGILACAVGQYCKDDEGSELGGLCVDTTTTANIRRLATYPIEDYIAYCGPYPPEDPFGYCDCSGVDNSTGAGTMYCSQNRTANNIQGCDEYFVYNFFTHSFNNSVLVKTTECYETTTPFMENICFFYDFEATEPVCSTEWNGQLCNSCTITKYIDDFFVVAFDCSNVGGRVGDSTRDVLSVFDLCANSTCTNLCGDGSYIPDYNFDINVTIFGKPGTCGILAHEAENGFLPDTKCPSFVEAAQTYCCASLNSTSPPVQDSTDEGAPARRLRAWER